MSMEHLPPLWHSYNRLLSVLAFGDAKHLLADDYTETMKAWCAPLKTIQVYRVSDREWVAARTRREAIQWYNANHEGWSYHSPERIPLTAEIDDGFTLSDYISRIAPEDFPAVINVTESLETKQEQT